MLQSHGRLPELARRVVAEWWKQRHVLVDESPVRRMLGDPGTRKGARPAEREKTSSMGEGSLYKCGLARLER